MMYSERIDELTRGLSYGVIYVYGNPKQLHHLRWFASMIKEKMYPLKLEWRDADINGTLVVARRFNVGNVGKYATVQLRLSGMSESYALLAGMHTFSDCLQDIADPSEGDVVINDTDFADRMAPPSGPWGRSDVSVAYGEVFCSRYEDRGDEDYTSFQTGSVPQDHTRVEMPPHKRVHIDAMQQQPKRSIEAEERREELAIERTRERELDDIRARIMDYVARYRDDPQALIGELLKGKMVLTPDGSPGHLLVNGDLKVVLPDYDEAEVRMTAMCRTVYILFLKLKVTGKGGMRLAEMDNYRDELMDIYGLVKPNASEERVQSGVDNLCDPMSNALNETISKINRYIKNVIINEQQAQQYMITGTRGSTYGVGLDAKLITLPRAVTGAV